MDTYEKILVVALATALAVFLTLSIVVLVKLIKIVNRVNRISEKLEIAANKAMSVGEMLARFGGPVAIGKFMASKFKSAKKSKRSK